MKKIIALLLVAAIMFCALVGCGKNDISGKKPTENVQVEENTNPEGILPEDKSNPTDEATVPSKDEVATVDYKETLYENVFKDSKFKLAYDSFKMNADDLIKTTFLIDTNNAIFYEMSGVLENKEIGVALLIKDTNNIYMHQFGTDEYDAIDQWFNCTVNDDTEEDTMETIDGDAMTEKFTRVISEINKVEFVETVDGLDKVIVYSPAHESEDETPGLIVDMSVEVEYNGEKGIYRYQKYADGDSGYSSTVSINNFSFGDYEFDSEKLTLTNDDEVIQCTLAENHLENPVELATEIKMEIMIDPDTYAIHKMVMTDETSAVSVIEFVNCADVMTEIALPEKMDEMPLEDAMTTFMIVGLGLIFANVEY
jgi:hypothetical protein